MKTRFPFLCLMFVVLCTPVPAQKPGADSVIRTPSDDSVVRISTTLVQIDAVVTDAGGHRVADLKPEDFEIFEDGRPKAVTHFSYVGTSSSFLSSALRTSSSSVPPVPLRPDQVRRTITLVVDDLTLSPGNVVYIRKALRKFVDERMRPGDLVAILGTGKVAGFLPQFTSDKRLLNAAIDRVSWNPRSIQADRGVSDPLEDVKRDIDALVGGKFRAGNRDSCAFPGGTPTCASPTDFGAAGRKSGVALRTLGILGAVVRGLNDLPGRKSVILLSEEMVLFTPGKSDENTHLRSALRDLTDLANRSSVVFHAIDARGLVDPSFQADERMPSSQQGRIAETTGRLHGVGDGLQGLKALADNTGGLVFSNSNDLGEAVVKAVEDQAGYYLIGYAPDEAVFGTEKGRANFHKVKVTVKRPGLKVRSRSGFYGVSDEDPATTSQTPESRLRRALTSPFASKEIGVGLSSFFGDQPKTGPFLRSVLSLDARDLSFAREADGTWKSVLDLAAMTFDELGHPTDHVNDTLTIRLTDEKYRKSLIDKLTTTFDMPARRTGFGQLRVVVRDTASDHIGSAHQIVEIPDLKNGRLALSGVVLAPLVRGPRSSSDGGSSNAEDVAARIALRSFPRGTPVSAGFIVHNAKINPNTRQPDLVMQVRIFRDGTEIHASPPEPIRADGQADVKRIAAGKNFAVGGKMELGKYQLQVIVSDRLDKSPHRTVVQWTDFDVAP